MPGNTRYPDTLTSVANVRLAACFWLQVQDISLAYIEALNHAARGGHASHSESGHLRQLISEKKKLVVLHVMLHVNFWIWFPD